MNHEYVNYGCGYSAPEKWQNFDASPTLRFERIPIIGKLYTKNSSRFPANVEFGNIVDGLPIPNESCKGIYCSHILEHLSLEDFRSALKNTYKILKSQGHFRLVMPDLEYSINKYINDPSSDASLVFLKETSLGKERRNRGLTGFALEWLGNSQHLWMWDYRSIAQELKNIGFIDIRRAQFGDASDPMFKDVEDESRWVNCLGVECRKA
ncbi:class I SAM-dependent methyltransferase [Pseudanabaena sp. ABRG5-3]|jgi:hypothetical protein|uniref:class I SAM-dependent methyltransferase n=1 Tax=Pseudanabaena sp. ABRG5-3 TaxID=685565 RepID=UPI000DC724E7|nr:methyltransferase domain-containing protein [Pseudanabaena sp. ABRG5-3]BBC25709.1 methyltransferase type 11 [Pseudanabaena sp. ABRG5-3]